MAGFSGGSGGQSGLPAPAVARLLQPSTQHARCHIWGERALNPIPSIFLKVIYEGHTSHVPLGWVAVASPCFASRLSRRGGHWSGSHSPLSLGQDGGTHLPPAHLPAPGPHAGAAHRFRPFSPHSGCNQGSRSRVSPFPRGSRRPVGSDVRCRFSESHAPAGARHGADSPRQMQEQGAVCQRGLCPRELGLEKGAKAATDLAASWSW